MTLQKNFWATNLKTLRNRRKLSQDLLAEQLGMTRSKYNAQENGQTVNPTVEDLFKISDFYRISVDNLLRTDISILSDGQLSEIEKGNTAYQKGEQLRVLAISTDKNNRENLEYVPIKARAGYLAGHNDPEFIASLPKFSLPQLPSGNTFRMFPTTGDSMLPIPEKSDIIARFVRDWKHLKPQTLCIVILRGEQDFVFKQVTQQGKEFLLESLNKTYHPYTVPISDVLELWQFHSYQTQILPEPFTETQDLSRSLKTLQADIRVLLERAQK